MSKLQLTSQLIFRSIQAGHNSASISTQLRSEFLVNGFDDTCSLKVKKNFITFYINTPPIVYVV